MPLGIDILADLWKCGTVRVLLIFKFLNSLNVILL